MNPIKGWLADAEKEPGHAAYGYLRQRARAGDLRVAWYRIWQQSWLYTESDGFPARRSALTRWCLSGISGWI